MAKRPAIEHILKWKERRGQSRVGDQLLRKVEGLARAWEEVGKNPTFGDFLPIRLVTLIEVYVRETIADVVDADPVYLDRAEPLLKNANLDFLAAKSVHGRKVSLGDIVAHALSISELKHVISAYETLLPGYRRSLASVTERWVEERGQRKAPILQDVDRVLGDIARLFEVRHIITHEVPGKRPYSLEELQGFLASVRDFLTATDWFIVGALKGDVPRTQVAMNASAAASLDLATKEMNDVLAAAHATADVNLDLLDRSQRSWQHYAECQADLHAGAVAGGSMEPMVRAFYQEELTRERIKALRWWLGAEEGDV